MPAQPSPTAEQLALWVAAWHNRHPLAIRVGPEQVRGIGVVALPFADFGTAPAGEPATPAALTETGLSLRERALANTQRTPEPGDASVHGSLAPASSSGASVQPLKAGFVEDFIAPLSPRLAARFAGRHGVAADPSAGTWPRREVAIDAGLCRGNAPCWRYLNTAAIETLDRRTRVLIAADGSPAVVGARLWDRGRIQGLGAALVAAVALMAVQVLPETVETQATTASAPDPIVSIRVDEPAAVVQEPATASAPPPAGPEATDAPAVDIRPRLDPEAARAARALGAELRAARRTDMPEAAPAVLAAQKGDAGKSYALVARQTKSRAASELLLTVMASEASRQGRAEVVRSVDGFRASWWPFSTREDAELARERLAGQGLPVEVVEF